MEASQEPIRRETEAFLDKTPLLLGSTAEAIRPAPSTTDDTCQVFKFKAENGAYFSSSIGGKGSNVFGHSYQNLAEYGDSRIYATEVDSNHAGAFGVHLAATPTAISAEVRYDDFNHDDGKIYPVADLGPVKTNLLDDNQPSIRGLKCIGRKDSTSFQRRDRENLG